jgi:hypothetical protein
MIVAETAEHYRFITQTDHAELAGQLAQRWGNDEFERPTPYPAVVLAAYNHDDGWWEYDRRPHLDEDGEPINFTGISADPWVDLYDEGIRTVVEMDRYAGLLVSMHGSGLRRRRYGLSSSWPDTQPAFEAFVERQENLQARLADELLDGASGGEDDGASETGAAHGTGDERLTELDAAVLSTLHERGHPSDSGGSRGSRLWCNYKLLQAWDTLSLAFCTTESPPGYDPIDDVPTAPDGADESLSLTPLGDGEYRVEPYPFDPPSIEVSVPTRTVRKADVNSEESAIRAYYGAPREVETFTLRRDG